MQQDADSYLGEYTLDVVRIPQEEYGGIPSDGFLAHFNLAHTTVEVGKQYTLPHILRHGYLKEDGEEVPPELSFDDVYVGEVLEVRNNISYDALTAADFEHSMTHIQTVDALKLYIIARYSKSKPGLSEADILSRGVSRMLLQLSKI
jgi:hypothetical protein